MFEVLGNERGVEGSMCWTVELDGLRGMRLVHFQSLTAEVDKTTSPEKEGEMTTEGEQIG
jgi:hypothetical protein